MGVELGSGGPAGALAPVSRRSVPRALVVSLRPRQWTKNGALLAPLVFALRATDPASVRSALVGVLAFSLLASAAYLANDLSDRENDRLHPFKRLRPIAAGELPVTLAFAAAGAAAAGGFALSITLGTSFVACAGGYLGLQILYSTLLKHVAVLDVFAIAAGFVLRVIAGAEAIAVPISNWLYLCTMLLALFLALEKRRAEMMLLEGGAGRHRRALAGYSLALVDQLVSIAAASTLLAYALYTLAPDTIQKFGSDRLKYTIPFVLFGLFRYLFLVHQRGEGGAPERVLLKDRATQLNLVAYMAVVAWAIYTRAP